MGVVNPGGDIDALCVVPNFVSRDAFFESFLAKLQQVSSFSLLLLLFHYYYFIIIISSLPFRYYYFIIIILISPNVTQDPNVTKLQAVPDAYTPIIKLKVCFKIYKSSTDF